MRILHVNNFDVDHGGAAIAMYRLHTALIRAGVDSQILMRRHLGGDPRVYSAIRTRDPIRRRAVKIARRLDPLPLRRYPGYAGAPWSNNWLPSGIADEVRAREPDLVHLHWIGDGLVPPGALARLGVPVVWTHHDLWGATGGCHIPGDCARYREGCGRCPQLDSDQPDDLSARNWRRKAAAWADVPITAVGPSRWMVDCIASSPLFAAKCVEHIPNAIDTATWQPLDRAFARRALHLPTDRRLLMFGATSISSDRNKGVDLLVAALEQLAAGAWADRIALVLLGNHPPDAVDLPFPAYATGYLTDDIRLPLYCAAVDAVVSASRSENLPNVLIEALACGTPGVAFRVGGIPDIIDHQENGYLARPFAIEDLAAGIAWVLDDEARHARLGAAGRAKIERTFSERQIAAQHVALYRDLLGG
jgi:glycosyltransferase involved in cell wall biosynthesis